MNEKRIGQTQSTDPADKGSPPCNKDCPVARLDLVQLDLKLSRLLRHLSEEKVSGLAFIWRLDELIDDISDARRRINDSTTD
jgi:hypothetical protein